MAVKYEYVVYAKDIETPQEVADTDGTMTADEVVRVLQDAIRLNFYDLVEVARREKGSINWHNIPEAF